MYSSTIIHTYTLFISTFYGSLPVALDAYQDSAEMLAVQGEYVGQLLSQSDAAGKRGLQVIALGDGQYDGTMYVGGLPGDGWNLSEPLQLHGDDSSGAVILKPDDGSLVAVRSPSQPSFWQLFDEQGLQITTLSKVFRSSPTLGQAPPENAIVLFDGAHANHLENARISEEGLLEVGTWTKDPVQDFFLHIEFRTPFMPSKTGQARGNSGIYIQRRYEVQILDSFGLEGVENECGGIYKQKRPDVNMCLPPLSWQTYDIAFDAARFSDDGDKVKNAKITVRQNGVLIHDAYEIVAKTGAGKQEGPEPLSILFQDHRDPVNFQNIWLVSRDAEQEAAEQAAKSQHGKTEAEITIPCEQTCLPCHPTCVPTCQPRWRLFRCCQPRIIRRCR